MSKVIAQPVEDVFGFKIPQRLELQPFADVFFELLNLVLNESEWALECCVREASKLWRHVNR